MKFIGIDPGKTGAVVILQEDNSHIGVYDTPVIVTKTKIEYNIAEMANILREYALNSTTIYIEKVNAMPGQGVVSMFSFGKGFGIWLGIISAFQLPLTLVTPQMWKKEMMQGMAMKDDARLRACFLFPSYAHLFSEKKHIGRADAILIAEYARRKERI